MGKEKEIEESIEENVGMNKMHMSFRTPDPGEEIVISGIFGTFPSSKNVHEFRENLLNKVEMVTTNMRWDYSHPDMPKYSGLIPDVDKYDAGFFARVRGTDEPAKAGDNCRTSGDDRKGEKRDDHRDERMDNLRTERREDLRGDRRDDVRDERRDGDRRDDRRDDRREITRGSFDREQRGDRDRFGDRDGGSRSSRDDGDCRGYDRDRRGGDDRDHRGGEKRDRRGGDDGGPRGGNDDGSSWRSVKKLDEETPPLRPASSRGDGDGLSDSVRRAGKDGGRKNEPLRKGDDKRGAPPQREKPACEQPPQPEGEEGWA